MAEQGRDWLRGSRVAACDSDIIWPLGCHNPGNSIIIIYIFKMMKPRFKETQKLVPQVTWRNAQFEAKSVWSQSSDTCHWTTGASCVTRSILLRVLVDDDSSFPRLSILLSSTIEYQAVVLPMKNFSDLFSNMEIRVPDNQSSSSHLLDAKHCREGWGGRRRWTRPRLWGVHSPHCKHRPSGMATRLGEKSPKPQALRI